jgi:hypothetical protein
MSKLVCICDHVISDTTDYLPYKAALIRDIAEELFFESISKENMSFSSAKENGELDKWVKERWNSDDWSPTAEQLFYDRLTSFYFEHFTMVYECQNCGRLMVEKKETRNIVFYKPESGHYEKILDQNSAD